MNATQLKEKTRASLPAAGEDREWYKDAILYQLHVRAFHDSNQDGIGGRWRNVWIRSSRRSTRKPPGRHRSLTACSSCTRLFTARW